MKKKIEGMLETIEYDVSPLFFIEHDKNAVSYPKHWHSGVEVIMPLRGGYDVYVNDYPYRLEERDIILIPTGDVHELRALKNTDKTHIGGERIVFLFDFALLKAVKGLADMSFVFFKPWLITAADSPELHGSVKTLLLEILEEYMAQRECFEASITAKLINMAVFMTRGQNGGNTYDLSEGIMKRKTQIINFNRCVEYINQHYKDDLPLEYVSSITGFSKFHFTRWFKQFAGISFYEYLTQVRIKVAESMLANSEAPITEIALESGFQSIATFNRVFKNNKNITPTEFRDKQRAKNVLTI